MTKPTLHPMDELPTERNDGWRAGDSVDVLLHYADGSTVRGYRSGWSGWIRYEIDGMLWACDDDKDQPIGWSEVKP